jgi:hypothetical protein
MRQSLPASTQPALNPSPSQKGEQLHYFYKFHDIWPIGCDLQQWQHSRRNKRCGNVGCQYTLRKPMLPEL